MISPNEYHITPNVFQPFGQLFRLTVILSTKDSLGGGLSSDISCHLEDNQGLQQIEKCAASAQLLQNVFFT